MRLAIVSARSDVCGASNSTWSVMFIESISTDMAISSGMALVPVTISLLLQRCPSTSGGKLSHHIYIQQLTTRCCHGQLWYERGL